MRKKISIILVLLTVFSGVLPFFAPSLTLATGVSGVDDIKTGLGTIADSVGLKVGSGDPDSIITTIGNIVSTLLKFLGVAFLLLIIYAGVKWMLSMGESKKVESAKKIIYNASIGLAVVVLSFVIVSFVLNILETGSGGGGGGGGSCIGAGVSCTPGGTPCCSTQRLSCQSTGGIYTCLR